MRRKAICKPVTEDRIIRHHETRHHLFPLWQANCDRDSIRAGHQHRHHARVATLVPGCSLRPRTGRKCHCDPTPQRLRALGHDHRRASGFESTVRWGSTETARGGRSSDRGYSVLSRYSTDVSRGSIRQDLELTDMTQRFKITPYGDGGILKPFVSLSGGCTAFFMILTDMTQLSNYQKAVRFGNDTVTTSDAMTQRFKITPRAHAPEGVHRGNCVIASEASCPIGSRS